MYSKDCKEHAPDRVIILNDHAEINGGADKVAINTARILADHDVNTTFVAACGPVDQSLRDRNISVYCFDQVDAIKQESRAKGALQGLNNRNAVEQLEQICAGLDNPESSVVHLHSWTHALSPEILRPIRDNNLRLLITAHDYFLVCPNGGFFNFQQDEICNLKPFSKACMSCNCDKRSYWEKLYRSKSQKIMSNHLMKMHPSIAFVSEFQRSHIDPLIGYPHAAFTLQNPIETHEVSETVRFNDNDKYLFIGRFDQEKGIGLFCEALKQLDLLGIAIGDSDRHPDLVRQYPNVEFTGWLEFNEMDEYIRQSRALIFSSKLYECSPLTISEVQRTYAMPCIVPRESAAYDLVGHGGGIAFHSNDIESLKEAISAFQDDEWVLDSMDNSKSAESGYSDEDYYKNLMGVYSNTIRVQGC